MPSDFDSLVDDNAQAPTMQPQSSPSFDSLQDDSEKYGTTGQQAITGLEGAGRGLLGPIAPIVESGLLKVPKEDILARQKENPIASGVGEAAGFGAGMLAGTGEAALMGKAGEAAVEAAGLANLGKEASLGSKIGSSAVQQAAEMAVLSGGDEASKLLLQDPETSAESAIANVGMAAALGGAGGAFITGAVSPLWSATAGPKVEALLSGLKDHINGVGTVLPEQTADAMAKLGIEAAPEIRAGLSGNPSAVEKFNILKETQNKHIVNGINKLNKDASESVMNSLGLSPSDIEVHSDNEAGQDLLNTFKHEYSQKYEPIAENLRQRDLAAAGIDVTDDARMHSYGQLLENGMNKVGTDSPYYKLYNDYGNRILAKDTVGQLDMLKSEINGELKKAYRAGDVNTAGPLKDIKAAISELQEQQIQRHALEQEVLSTGAKSYREGQGELLNRAVTNQQYSNFAKMSDELTNHLGIGDFKGAGTLASKITDKISPEELLRKFSIKNNADFIKFLGENFPETLQKVQENELKKLLKPAVLGAKDDMAVNVKKLNDIVSKGLAGQKEYIESIIPKEALDKIQAANTLSNAIPSPRSSGTAGWMAKVMAKMPQSALSAVAMITGHNPLFGYLSGEMAQHLGRTVPDAINLGYLKFLGSNQPIKSEGFKAMVDFFHNTYRGSNAISKATAAVLQGGSKVLTVSQMPSKADTEKLDKIVTKMQSTPDKVYALQNGHVGHYLPEHQVGLTQASTRALQYLQSIKPQPFKASPLDKEIPPSKSQEMRYQRALDIAEQPAVILQHVKDGTIQTSDLQDLNAMYPGLYKRMSMQLSNEITSNVSNEEPVPYKTRVGLSLFLGQPLDSSMKPMSIQAAQSTYAPKAPQQAQNAPKKKGTSALGKTNKSYQTASQAAESDRSGRD